jgi:hypothetical protein
VTFNSLPSDAVNATTGALTAAAVVVLKTALQAAVATVCAACSVTIKKVVDSGSGATLYEARRLAATYGVTVTFATSGASATSLAAVTAATSTSAFTATATTAVASNTGYASVTVAAVAAATSASGATSSSLAIGLGVGLGGGGALALLAALWYCGVCKAGARKSPFSRGGLDVLSRGERV